MFDTILVVCMGNICRSPTGERLLMKYCQDKKIESAGIGALSGHAADETSARVALAHNLSLDMHIAKQLTRKICQDNDLILVMEKKHIDLVCNIAPEVRGKIMLFGHWTLKEIPDPYKKSEETFQLVYQLLDEAAEKWAQALKY
ncbi:protein tyrosine phosphatase [Serratia fonticola]|uniref:arsenate reductase/protein-tyrosine-phosphatase family protein n=1 Tax=Serratia fonticola TaxID=47917 RepID=UPI001ED8E6D0|nr:protein tyrosine phosphatase [Serratia fonticola]